VVQDAVARARPRLHADEERRVASVLEELRVLRPLLLGDELAAGVEVVGKEGVERPAPPAPWQSMATISAAPAAFAPRTAALISSV